MIVIKRSKKSDKRYWFIRQRSINNQYICNSVVNKMSINFTDKNRKGCKNRKNKIKVFKFILALSLKRFKNKTIQLRSAIL